MTHRVPQTTQTPIVAFVGRSNSGKTTLIERLIPELVLAGYRVATVKHAGHGFDLDTEGKDSWRHKRAGASTVIVVSKGSLALFSDLPDDVKVEALRERFMDPQMDLILAEGWKSEGYPKVLVVRDQLGEVPITEEGLLAVVTNNNLSVTVRVFDPDVIKGLSGLRMRHFPRRAPAGSWTGWWAVRSGLGGWGGSGGGGWA